MTSLQGIQENTPEAKETAIEVGDTVVTENLELQTKKKEDPNLIDFYAKNYQLYIHTFCNYIDRLPLKSLRRVVKAIAKYPLETEEFKPQGVGSGKELEKQAFGVGNQVFTAKYMMVSLVNLDEALNEQNKQLETIPAEPVKEGETNG